MSHHIVCHEMSILRLIFRTKRNNLLNCKITFSQGKENARLVFFKLQETVRGKGDRK